MRAAVGTTWVVAESGACGPTFAHSGIEHGFTALFVSGPVERAAWVESDHAEREANMWGFAKAALDLLAACLSGSAAAGQPASPQSGIFEGREDRFGGVTVDVAADCAATTEAFAGELRSRLAEWASAGKRGIWFKVPLSCARLVLPLSSEGFKFHHAKEEHVMLSRWLEASPCKLPRYSFTLLGVGGAVVNSRNEVLMVQERLVANAKFQGLWKLPGGLADPGEDLAVAAGREVLEETGIKTEPVGVVSIRHAHGLAFGQGDIYCVLRLRPLSEDIKIDPEEIASARWMSLQEIEKRVPADDVKTMADCVSKGTFTVISQAVHGALIHGALVPSTAGKSVVMYTAAGKSDAA
ncbi:unnamed protein product [Prorocentrum cordatum]|nr:unnamed protein product [Polarella glacialis]